MSACCDDTDELAPLRKNQARVLKIVLAVNAIMFVLEFGAGLRARSSALMADSLDMLGDAAAYAVTLYVLDRGPRWRAAAALFKGLLILAFGLGVLAEAAAKIPAELVPRADWIGGVGFLALAANLSCMALLFRHRGDDLNMRSTWLCTVDDVAANAGVLAAAAAVAYTGSKWPDIAAGGLIAGIFLFFACSVLRQARGACRELVHAAMNSPRV